MNIQEPEGFRGKGFGDCPPLLGAPGCRTGYGMLKPRMLACSGDMLLFRRAAVAGLIAWSHGCSIPLGLV
jgi:hypothetical protein